MTVSGHTIHGPKGVGGLYVRRARPSSSGWTAAFRSSTFGPGSRTSRRRSALPRPSELVTEEETRRIQALRDRLLDRALTEMPHTTLNGHRTRRLPQNANITFHYVEGESITLHLDMRGFAVSTGLGLLQQVAGGQPRDHGHRRRPRARARLGALQLRPLQHREDVDAVVDAIARGGARAANHQSIDAVTGEKER